MVESKGFLTKTYVCEICGKESKDYAEIKQHEKKCGIEGKNPLEYLEYVGNLDTKNWLFDKAGDFKRLEDIDEKLAEFKNGGWIIHRKQPLDSYCVQWVPNQESIYFFEEVADGTPCNEVMNVSFEEAVELAMEWISNLSPEYSDKIRDRKGKIIDKMKVKAKEREEALDFESAIELWEEAGEIEEAKRVRKLKAEQGAVKIAQKVVHGDEVIKTEIKDSVLNRSNIGGKSSKAEELREAKSLFEEELIDDEEYKQMKKEILGK